MKTLDVLLNEETERSIQSADLILRSFQEKIASDGVTTTDELVAREAGYSNVLLLRSRFAGVPQVASLTALTPTGAFVVTSRAFPPPPHGLGERNYIKDIAVAKPDALVVSEPIRNMVDDAWTLYLCRRLNAPDGSLIGIVTVAINLSYFDDLYRTLALGQGGAASLWRSDGMLMARYPRLPAGIGRTYAIETFDGPRTPGQPHVYTEYAAIDGTSRLVSTIAAKDYPFIVDVTATLDEILQDWRQTVAIIAVGCVVGIVGVMLVMWLLTRQIRALRALSRAEAERGAAIAARHIAEDQLRQSQKLESIGQLTGGVAHDFNNLLTAVLGNLELLQRNAPDLSTRYQRWIKNAVDAAQRGAVLTQRLLAFSRRQPLNPTATDVGALMRAMSDLLERTLGENIAMELKLDSDLRHADVDANQLDNAILNIAINARDAMGGRGTLTVQARNIALDAAYCARNDELKAGDYVLVVIADTGSGIEPAVLRQVFEPFFTTKPIGQGTGLGLSQVYGFVKQTGGHIEIDSTVGVGTCLSIYLPCAKAESAAVSLHDGADGGGLRTGLRALVVEDDAVVRAYSLETMFGLGFETSAAADADEALAILRGGAVFDLLFTDVGLPGLNGHELATRAKALQPGLKVLFASGYTRDVLMHEGRLDKGVHLLAKPFTVAQLRAKLADVLAERPAPDTARHDSEGSATKRSAVG